MKTRWMSLLALAAIAPVLLALGPDVVSDVVRPPAEPAPTNSTAPAPAATQSAATNPMASEEGNSPSLETARRGTDDDKLEPTARAIADAITELDVEHARALFDQAPNAPGLAFQRARLAVYVGDCDSAEATLSTLPESPETANLGALASRCARATAGALVVDVPEAGVWIRFQDAKDEALVPLIAEVATEARKSMIQDLGVDLPRPLRIDVVRDLFSLSAVTGLPLEAAEMTGTVAVARWGRVTMISPRAARYGYPWQDTLAHEITHLALTRGSRDYAPLWLQEGIAKREEVRWREPRPFDSERNPHQIAREALLSGTSVGIDRIGPSIAMLPSPQAAAISYAEVESFMDFWINRRGRAAFALLLADLKGLGSRDTDAALKSITGYPLEYWIGLWQEHLLSLPDPPLPEPIEVTQARLPPVQSVRLGDMVFERGQVAMSAPYYDDALEGSPSKPAVRFRAAATQLAIGDEEAARERLGTLDDVSGLYGSWLGLHGRMLLAVQKANEAERAFEWALGVDPIGEEAACEGHSERTQRVAMPAPKTAPADATGATSPMPPLLGGTEGPLPLPQDPTRRRLCDDARVGRIVD